MSMTTDDVQRLAELAKLELTDDELKRFASELDALVGHCAQLTEVDVSGVEPTSQVTGLQNVLRDDIADDDMSLSYEEIESIAPQFRDGYLVVPNVLDKGDE